MRHDVPSPASSARRPSRGRQHPEDVATLRTEFERDRDRVTHSRSFRRLAHKTQVFIDPTGDHVRTRLTHTIEVSQIARSLARRLGLDEDLAETIALAHDLGHPPYGHEGEDALDLALADHGGFDHNAQAVRIVEVVERPYAAFDGLNLSYEAVEGIMAHNGPLVGLDGLPLHGGRPIEPAFASAAALHGVDMTLHASAEAQCAAVADDIAYDCHDIEDGVRSGLLTLGDVARMPIAGDVLRSAGVADRPERAVHEVTRRLMGLMVTDVLVTASRTLAEVGDADGVRRLGRPCVSFSQPFLAAEGGLKTYLRDAVYHSDALAPERARARSCVAELVGTFLERPELMPGHWGEDVESGVASVADQVRDYVSGMTDRFAINELERVTRAHVTFAP